MQGLPQGCARYVCVRVSVCVCWLVLTLLRVASNQPPPAGVTAWAAKDALATLPVGGEKLPAQRPRRMSLGDRITTMRSSVSVRSSVGGPVPQGQGAPTRASRTTSTLGTPPPSLLATAPKASTETVRVCIQVSCCVLYTLVRHRE